MVCESQTFSLISSVLCGGALFFVCLFVCSIHIVCNMFISSVLLYNKTKQNKKTRNDWNFNHEKEVFITITKQRNIVVLNEKNMMTSTMIEHFQPQQQQQQHQKQRQCRRIMFTVCYDLVCLDTHYQFSNEISLFYFRCCCCYCKKFLVWNSKN